MVITAHQVRPYGPGVTGEHYEIRVRGRLGPRWTAWFDDLAVVAEDDGTTVIRGALADQAALHGLLQRLRDLGVPLVSVAPVPPAAPPAPPAPRTSRGT